MWNSYTIVLSQTLAHGITSRIPQYEAIVHEANRKQCTHGMKEGMK